MDKFKALLQWLKQLPLWGRIVSVIAILAISAVLLLTSCGIARVKVYDSQNNEISVTSDPNTSINVTVKAKHTPTDTTK